MGQHIRSTSGEPEYIFEIPRCVSSGSGLKNGPKDTVTTARLQGKKCPRNSRYGGVLDTG